MHAHTLCQLASRAAEDAREEATGAGAATLATAGRLTVPAATMVVAAVATTLALGIDSREDGRWLQMHHDALVQQLVNDQDDAAHVVDERLSLDTLSENSIEALVHAVE